MTRAQKFILNYFKQKKSGHFDAEPEGVAALRVNGILYSVNIFCDILEIGPDGKNRVIARSDLPHSVLAPIKDPTKWEDLQ